ncbi:MAG: HIT family protein [Planctomycetota bacterium]|jgi:diadenosine tetraphosphate (Ap4A) HIT family hydrolase
MAGDGNEIELACLFCSRPFRRRAFAEHGTVFAVKDGFPVTEGHSLIIPKRHTADFFTMSEEERWDTNHLLCEITAFMVRDDPAITGFNVGTNCGVSGGQTVAHAHVHLIPRRDGDTPDPRGGVRGVIPDRQQY